MVIAFFKAELDPRVHLVEDGYSFDRVLDGAGCRCRRRDYSVPFGVKGIKGLGVLEVIGNSPIKTVCEVRLPASVPAFRFCIEPARERETDLNKPAVTTHRELWSCDRSPGAIQPKGHGGGPVYGQSVCGFCQTNRLVVGGQGFAAEEEPQVSSIVETANYGCPAGRKGERHLITVPLAADIDTPGESFLVGVHASCASRAGRYSRGQHRCLAMGVEAAPQDLRGNHAGSLVKLELQYDSGFQFWSGIVSALTLAVTQLVA